MKKQRIILIICWILLFSCFGENSEEQIILPPTSAIAIYNTWAVVNADYLRIRKNPSKNSEMLSALNSGTVVRILSKTENKDVVEQASDYWYQIDNQGLRGWVFGAYLDVYNSKSEAEARGKELK